MEQRSWEIVTFASVACQRAQPIQNDDFSSGSRSYPLELITVVLKCNRVMELSIHSRFMFTILFLALCVLKIWRFVCSNGTTGKRVLLKIKGTMFSYPHISQTMFSYLILYISRNGTCKVYFSVLCNSHLEDIYTFLKWWFIPCIIYQHCPLYSLVWFSNSLYLFVLYIALGKWSRKAEDSRREAHQRRWCKACPCFE